MAKHPDKPRSEADAALEKDIRERRSFSLNEAIGRLAGGGMMKGESPVARTRQAELEIEAWLRGHLPEAGASFEAVVCRHIKGNASLLEHADAPLFVLATFCQRVLASDYLLKEFVRDVDAEWGRATGERPRFEREGSPSEPDDPYTLDSTRGLLSKLLGQLAAESPDDKPNSGE